MDYTSRLGLKKPLMGEDALITDINSNMDLLDANAAGPKVVTSVTRPATPYTGQFIYESDTQRVFMWMGAWRYISGPPIISPSSGTLNLNAAGAGVWATVPPSATVLLPETGYYNCIGRLTLLTSISANFLTRVSANFWHTVHGPVGEAAIITSQATAAGASTGNVSIEINRVMYLQPGELFFKGNTEFVGGTQQLTGATFTALRIT